MDTLAMACAVNLVIFFRDGWWSFSMSPGRLGIVRSALHCQYNSWYNFLKSLLKARSCNCFTPVHPAGMKRTSIPNPLRRSRTSSVRCAAYRSITNNVFPGGYFSASENSNRHQSRKDCPVVQPCGVVADVHPCLSPASFASLEMGPICDFACQIMWGFRC